MATLIKTNLELRLKDTNDVGIPNGYVLIQSTGEPVRMAFDLVGELPEQLDEVTRQSIILAVKSELAALNLVPTRVFIGA